MAQQPKRKPPRNVRKAETRKLQNVNTGAIFTWTPALAMRTDMRPYREGDEDYMPTPEEMGEQEEMVTDETAGENEQEGDPGDYRPVSRMTKPELTDFAQQAFGVTLDQGLSAPAMRQKVKELQEQAE